jgi:S1-C subfamily serine protease
MSRVWKLLSPGLLVLASIGVAWCQNALTAGEIYRTDHDSVVEIQAGNAFGNGFIVSANGIIVTANDVVATRKSKYTQYAHDIKVTVFQNNKMTVYQATPLRADIPPDQTNFDYARLKISATNLPYVSLGTLQSTQLGDRLTILARLPNIGVLMLQGKVAGRSMAKIDLGPKPVNVVIFQCPVGSGFSGAPIFNSAGNVVAITTTKVLGVSPSLDLIRKALSQSKADNHGSDAGSQAGLIELIDNLDQNLISGLGGGVAIDYAKK